jgi:hypothetical protein
MADSHLYTMSVDLSVLESLGINLYSNAAAVLSELVANGYDADGNFVHIDWQQQGEVIVVTDDGNGMTVDELNERFLKVGYKKRSTEGRTSPEFERPYMGRKGIGKLSVFSIAETVVVYSTKRGSSESNGFQIDVLTLEQAIKAGDDYHPDPVPVPAEYQTQGTTIVLSDLKSKRANLTAPALRKRLARRFDVVDQRKPEEGGFYITVNGSAITYEDRQELKKLEFIWEFGEQRLPQAALPSGCDRLLLPDDTVNAAEGWKVRGWIGTARRPTDLTDDLESGSLKNIIVLARKRPIQEGIIEKLDFSRIFGNYVTGQIEADFLDLDDYEDIATSDRQRLMEDDERVVQLQRFLRKAFVKASEEWSDLRPKKEAKDALENYPALKEWLETRPAWQQGPARKMIGTIAGLPLERKHAAEDRISLFRAGILAFERVGLREVYEELEALSAVTAEDVLPLLASQETYEAGLWVDILRSRIEAISRFQDLTRNDEREKVLQEHLFNNLSLLDAAWERATLSPKMEENLRHIEPGLFATDENGQELFGRVDIRYATISGRHVIVELKRYSVETDVTVLREQGLKYFTALRSVLDQQNREDEEIEVVFVLGCKPKTAGKGASSEQDYIRDQFRGINGRYVLYDQLIDNAKNQYNDYLEASAEAQRLNALLDSLGGSTPDEE